MTKTTLALLGAVAALPLLGALAVSTPGAQEGAPMAAAERAATETVIREYLLANPEVVVEALERWRDAQELAAASQAEDAARANLAALLSAETGHALGAAADEAEVLVVEFFDYHCGYCRRATDFVMDLSEEDGIRVVFQDLPILREESRAAALAGLAASETGDYAALHRALMRTAGVLDEKAVQGAMRRAGARDAGDLLGDPAAAARLEAKLEGSVDIARAMGLEGTPTFVVASPDGAVMRIIPAYAPDAVEAAVAEVRAL